MSIVEDIIDVTLMEPKEISLQSKMHWTSSILELVTLHNWISQWKVEHETSPCKYQEDQAEIS